MSGNENTPLEDDPVLLPPPFGTTETTGEHLLPTATSMDELFRNETESGAQEAEAEEALPVEEAEVSVVAAESAPPPTVELQDEEPTHPVGYAELGDNPAVGGGNRMLWVGIVIFLIGGGLAWVFIGGAGSSSSASKGAETQSGAVPSSAGPEGTSPAADGKPEPSSASDAAPTELAVLRSLSFEERHAMLAKAEGDVPVELHIGLDLVQAKQSENPCRTFADALSTIESSEDRAAFDWALEDATAPTGDEPGCENLGSRLAALKDERPDEAPRAMPTRSSDRRAKKKKKSRPSKDEPSPPTPDPPSAAKPEPPPADEAETKPEAKPEAKPKSVATKLDDGELRGLGE